MFQSSLYYFYYYLFGPGHMARTNTVVACIFNWCLQTLRNQLINHEHVTCCYISIFGLSSIDNQMERSLHKAYLLLSPLSHHNTISPTLHKWGIRRFLTKEENIFNHVCAIPFRERERPDYLTFPHPGVTFSEYPLFSECLPFFSHLGSWTLILTPPLTLTLITKL